MGSGSSKKAVSRVASASTASPHTPQQPSQQTAQVEDEYIEDRTERVVLITGCSSGVGLALAVELATDPERRFKVYATMRNLGKKEELAEKTKDILEDLMVIKELDVCSDNSVNSAVDDIVAKEGKIDILVNNAAIGLFCVPECVSIDHFKTIHETNVFGAMRMTNAVIPHMKKQRTGHVLNIGSHLGIVGTPFSEAYCTSKFALEGYTECLAPVLAHFNIKITIVEPGPIKTNFAISAKSMREEIDISGTDDLTKELLEKALKVMYNSMATVGQTAEEVAKHIKNVLLLKHSPLRYQTNDKYRADQVAAKLSDPSGNKILNLLKEYFFGAST